MQLVSRVVCGPKLYLPLQSVLCLVPSISRDLLDLFPIQIIVKISSVKKYPQQHILIFISWTQCTFSDLIFVTDITDYIYVEKILSCGEISDFCKDFEQFMAFYPNLCHFRFKFVWRKICVEKISVDKYEVCTF